MGEFAAMLRDEQRQRERQLEIVSSRLNSLEVEDATSQSHRSFAGKSAGHALHRVPLSGPDAAIPPPKHVVQTAPTRGTKDKRSQSTA